MTDNVDDTGAAPTPEEEIRRIAARFERHRGEVNPWELAGLESARYGLASVCQVLPDRVLHVIGASEMAERIRDLLASGAVTGWRLQPMPATRTPLHHYLPAFQALSHAEGGIRGYKQLGRIGFAFGEEIAVCPDAVLLAGRNIGPRTLSKIREIIGGPPSLDAPPPAPQIDLAPLADPGVPADRTDLFSATTLARYPTLAPALATARMPAAALTAIAAALNNEPLPPAEATVELLLDTAGEHELLALYRSTHAPTPSPSTR